MPTPITKDGYEKKKLELDELERVEKPRITQAIAEARAALATLGGVLMLRSWRRATSIGWDAADKDDIDYAPARSFALAVALFLIYALLLVGRGLPFWLGTGIFVTAFVFIFQFPGRKAAGGVVRGVMIAVACGAITAAAVTYLFEHLFYVRLP